MPFIRTLALVALASAALALTGCGGSPLRVVAGGYDPIRVNAEHRTQVERAEQAATEAKQKREQTLAAIDAAEARAEAAEDELDGREGDQAAQARAKLAKLELTHAQWSAEEAEQAWLVALADLELKKHIANQGKGDADEQLERDLVDQLADLKNKHAAAAKSLAASEQDLKEARAAAEPNANPY